MLKNEAERLSYFDGKFVKSEIAEFVFGNKLPLVTIFSRETAPSIFEGDVMKQGSVLLRYCYSPYQMIRTKFSLRFRKLQNCSNLYLCSLIWIRKTLESRCDYFGISGDDPKVVGFSANEDNQKFILDGDEFTLDSVKIFAENFFGNKLKPFYKSDPITETNDGDVKIVVGNNFDEIVLDESRDVLLEIYSPWCGHCHALEPTYNKLAKHLRGIGSLVIAKMDGTSNEHPKLETRASIQLVWTLIERRLHYTSSSRSTHQSRSSFRDKVSAPQQPPVLKRLISKEAPSLMLPRRIYE